MLNHDIRLILILEYFNFRKTFLNIRKLWRIGRWQSFLKGMVYKIAQINSDQIPGNNLLPPAIVASRSQNVATEKSSSDSVKSWRGRKTKIRLK